MAKAASAAAKAFKAALASDWPTLRADSNRCAGGLTYALPTATSTASMLRLLCRLRQAHLLALLAVLVMASLGPHAHASTVVHDGADVVSVSDAGHDDQSDGAAAGPHCGLCHAARGMLPLNEGVRSPILLAVRVAVAAGVVPAALLAPDVPSPPPRLSHAA